MRWLELEFRMRRNHNEEESNKIDWNTSGITEIFVERKLPTCSHFTGREALEV